MLAIRQYTSAEKTPVLVNSEAWLHSRTQQIAINTVLLPRKLKLSMVNSRSSVFETLQSCTPTNQLKGPV
jgi:hypothetical protein